MFFRAWLRRVIFAVDRGDTLTLRTIRCWLATRADIVFYVDLLSCISRRFFTRHRRQVA